MATPHRIVDEALDGLADAAAGLIRDMGSSVKGAGEKICTALDAPLAELGAPKGIHRAVDRVLDSVVDAGVNWPADAIIKPLKTLGEGLASGLDLMSEEWGIPPDLGKAFKLPKIFGK